MMIDSYLHMVPGFLNSQVSLGIWHAMATCSSHTLAVPDTTICSDSQVIIFGESTCSHALLDPGKSQKSRNHVRKKCWLSTFLNSALPAPSAQC